MCARRRRADFLIIGCEGLLISCRPTHLSSLLAEF